MKDHDGYLDPVGMRLVITDKPATKDYRLYLIVHECIHALCDTYGILSPPVLEGTEDIEEYLATYLSPLLIQLYRDNPGLMI
jgi:hypothetical protein